MDIEQMSMNMSQARLMDAVSTKVLSMSLDLVEQGADGLIEMMDESMMETAVDPNLGGNLDIKI
ncbi:MAG: YjfB family protein [Lachnospiraceae bacterium]|nr:YjfB family protein [Lachnospiraceae bacterium]